MQDQSLQNLCGQGQLQLQATQYLDAAATLAHAEQIAWNARDFDTLSRLYMPLQEARRQIRQRCGEGEVRMHLLADAPGDVPHWSRIPSGQLLIAGWGHFQPAGEARKAAALRKLYIETFLGAIYPTFDSKLIAIIPTVDAELPLPSPRSREELQSLLPPGSLLLIPADLPADTDRGTADSYAAVMALWERLHTPFLQAAEKEIDPIKKMELFRRTIQVDPACELAHQHLADVARSIARAGV